MKWLVLMDILILTLFSFHNHCPCRYVNMVSQGESENWTLLILSTLSGTWLTSKEKGCNRLIPTETVNGDVFATGCLLFYFFEAWLISFRFGRQSDPSKQTNNYPVNLKIDQENDFLTAEFSFCVQVCYRIPADVCSVSFNLNISSVKFEKS